MKSNQVTVGDWTVDPLAGQISGSEGTTHLEPKVMQVLMYLVSNAGDVVTRDEILTSVWGSRGAVSDEPLTRCIKVLRHALGDSVGEPKYIRTVPKVGYALIAPVVEATEQQEPSASEPVPPESAGNLPGRDRRGLVLSKRGLLLAAGGIIAVIAGWQFLSDPMEPGAVGDHGSERPSIAVLPFKAGGVADHADYLGAGIAGEVRFLLGQIRELKVAAGLSSTYFADSGTDLTSTAAGLGVDYILDGTLQQDGDHIHVFVELTNGADGFQLWSEKYDFDFESGRIHEIQTRIANSAVDTLVETLALPSQVPRFDVTVSTESTAAYESYLRGKEHMNLRTSADLDAAIERFEAAIEADPEYSMAYVAMAYAESLGPASLGVFETGDSFERSRQILRTARDIDPGVADAALGIEAFIDLREGRLVSAYSAYRKSLERFPNEPILHHGISLLMSTVGRHEEALEHALVARSLDPKSPIANGRLAVAYLWAGQVESSELFFNQSFELGLDTVQNMQASLLLLLRTGRFEKLRDLGRRLEEALGTPMPWWDAFVDASAERTAPEAAVRSIEASDDFKATIPTMQLGAWAMLGEVDEALNVLERILQANPTALGGFLFSAELADIRQDERFSALLVSSPIYRFWNEHGWSPLCQADTEIGIRCR